MRIPNVGAASSFAGISSQASKETSDSSKSKAANAEANRHWDGASQIEDVSESQETGDRDAQEKYQGPALNSQIGVQSTGEQTASEFRDAPSLFDLSVADDSPPPSLDTQA